MTTQVTVIAPDLRRVTLKVAPSTSLQEILNQASQRLKLETSTLGLKSSNNRSELDLSLPFRLSGLAPGAKLELVQTSRSPKILTIGLEVERSLIDPSSGGGQPLRPTLKLPTSFSLWQVLRQFEELSQENYLTQGLSHDAAADAAAPPLYAQPIVNLGGRPLESLSDLQTPLHQLGLTHGSHLLRLSFRKTDEPLEGARQRLKEFFGSESLHVNDNATSIGVSTALGETSAVDNPPVSTVEAVQLATQRVPSPSNGEMENSHPLRGHTPLSVSAIYSPTISIDTRRPDRERGLVDDSDTGPTLSQFRNYKRQLEEASRPTRAPSDQEILESEQAKQARLSNIDAVTIRLEMPDRHQVDALIYQETTAEELYGFVSSLLVRPDAQFRLLGPFGASVRSSLPRSSKRLIMDLKVKRATKIHLAFDTALLNGSTENGLRDDLKDSACSLPEVTLDSGTVEEAQTSVEPPKEDKAKGGRAKMEKTLFKFLNKPGAKR